MKYIVTLHTTAEMVATVEVKAKNPEQAREKALAMAPEVDFELDSLNYDHVTAEDVEEDESMKKYLVEVSRDVREYQTILVEADDERHARNKATLKTNEVPDDAWSRGEIVACDTWDCSELKEED